MKYLGSVLLILWSLTAVAELRPYAMSIGLAEVRVDADTMSRSISARVYVKSERDENFSELAEQLQVAFNRGRFSSRHIQVKKVARDARQALFLIHSDDFARDDSVSRDVHQVLRQALWVSSLNQLSCREAVSGR